MTPDDFDYLRGFLKERSGLALSAEKQYLIDTRLSPVIRARGLDNMSALVRAVRSDPRSDLATLVLETMTTNESLFFRDKIPFDNFRNVIAPALRSARARERSVLRASISAARRPRARSSRSARAVIERRSSRAWLSSDSSSARIRSLMFRVSASRVCLSRSTIRR